MYRPLPDGLTIKNSPIEGLGLFTNVNIKKNTKDEITDYLLNANRILNSAVYGHKKAKCQILQIVSQWISNPQAKGSVFAIMGPMGNGKTTLVNLLSKVDNFEISKFIPAQ